VQIVWSKRNGSRDIQHIGSAHDDAELAALRAAAAAVIHRGQGELDVGGPRPAGRLVAAASRSARLWEALETAWRAVGFDRAVPDEVFKGLALGRVVEPTSKLDTIRVLGELGVSAPSYSTIKRRLRQCVEEDWRAGLQAVCVARAAGRGGGLRYCLYDVTTLYWEAHEGDGFREPGFSKERRLEPQVVVGLLTTREGFPLKVDAFEGNKAETKTILPVLKAFAKQHDARGITVVADAGMMSEGNMAALLGAGSHVIVGQPIPDEPHQVAEWRRKHPGRPFKDGRVFIQPTTVGPKGSRKWCVVYYQWRAKRARRDLKGVDKTLAKARRQVAGEVPAHHNRFVRAQGGALEVNDALVASARSRAGLRAYFTDLPYAAELADRVADLGGDPAAKRREHNRLRRAANPVIAAYHDLWHVEHAFRMSKSDLAARPAFHWHKDSIQAHLTVVFAALAVASWIESAAGISVRRFVRLLRPIREVDIDIAGHVVTAEDEIEPLAAKAIADIKSAAAGARN
jgi:hypothetical protein